MRDGLKSLGSVVTASRNGPHTHRHSDTGAGTALGQPSSRDVRTVRREIKCKESLISSLRIYHL